MKKPPPRALYQLSCLKWPVLSEFASFLKKELKWDEDLLLFFLAKEWKDFLPEKIDSQGYEIIRDFLYQMASFSRSRVVESVKSPPLEFPVIKVSVSWKFPFDAIISFHPPGYKEPYALSFCFRVGDFSGERIGELLTLIEKELQVSLNKEKRRKEKWERKNGRKR